jgi:hypothetical protein
VYVRIDHQAAEVGIAVTWLRGGGGVGSTVAGDLAAHNQIETRSSLVPSGLVLVALVL